MMLVLVLLSWWLLQRRQSFLSIIILILAAHVKLTALIWLPAFAIWIVREWGWRRALQIGLTSAIIGLMLSWLLYAPFDGWQTLRMLQNVPHFCQFSMAYLEISLINQLELVDKRASAP
jgi:Gpi18-like mannosyltransferase